MAMNEQLAQQNEWHYPSQQHWGRYEKAPRSIPRPELGQVKGYVYFFASAVDCMDDIWETISLFTLDGFLGYYCGYSDDSQVIAIHFADPNDEELQEDIIGQLIDLGVDEYQIIFETKVEENDLQRYQSMAEY